MLGYPYLISKCGGNVILQRSQWDIMASILRLAENPMSKTRIMYGANLSFRQLERYLKFLLDSGFLTVNEERHSRVNRLFATTDSGSSFVKAYGKLEEITKGSKRF